MSHPTCSVYLQTVEGQQFGPYSVDVWLTNDWEIIGQFVWVNKTKEDVHIDKVVMLAPIGVEIFEGHEIKVCPKQEAHINLTITNELRRIPEGTIVRIRTAAGDQVVIERGLDKPDNS